MSIHLPIATISGAENRDLCSRCEGQCCKGAPGASDPSDFFDADGNFDEYALLEKLESGDWVIGFWDGDPRQVWNRETGEPLIPLEQQLSVSYYPHPAYKEKTGELVERRFFWKLGGCILLSEDGCRLSFEDRPYGCRSLIPAWDSDAEDFACSHADPNMKDNKRAALNWLPYQDKLLEVARAVEPEGYW